MPPAALKKRLSKVRLRQDHPAAGSGRAGELGDIVEITAVPRSLEAVVGHLGAAQEFFGIEVGGQNKAN